MTSFDAIVTISLDRTDRVEWHLSLVWARPDGTLGRASSSGIAPDLKTAAADLRTLHPTLPAPPIGWKTEPGRRRLYWAGRL